MPGPLGELKTRENLFSRERHQKSPAYGHVTGHVTKLFLEMGFQHKGNKQMKKTQILSKILQFSRQHQIQKIKLFKYYIEKGKNKIWTELSLLGQEPTFTIPVIHKYCEQKNTKKRKHFLIRSSVNQTYSLNRPGLGEGGR